jgi:aspartate-semialdehyde dehydrogenase
MVVALKPLHDIAQIKRVVVSTYQSVSGAGKAAMDELFDQTRSIYTNGAAERNVFSKQISFNVIPQIDVFMDDGYTKEEWKMRVETRKILGKDIDVTATCVRVPVFVCHSEAVNVEFKKPITVAQARKALQKAPGIVVVDKHDPESGFVTPAEVSGEDAVYVSRIRKDETVKNGLNMWVVADNLRKGAATNAVQIAEILAKKYL